MARLTDNNGSHLFLTVLFQIHQQKKTASPMKQPFNVIPAIGIEVCFNP